MNKFKIIAVLALVLSTTACSDDNYVSQRHPEGEVAEVSDEALDIEGDKANNEEDATNEDNEESEENNQEQAENPDEPREVTDADLEENNSDAVTYTVDSEVNVRLAPSEDSNIITTVNKGASLVKLGESDNWTRVTVNGQTGYIRSDLIKAK